MESNLPPEIRGLLRRITGSSVSVRHRINCFPGTSHTDPRRLPYSYSIEKTGQDNFSPDEYWVSNIDGIFFNYETDRGILIDTRIYKSDEEKEMQRKAIESFDYSRGLVACLLKFPNGDSPHNATTVVHLYDGTKWYDAFELNEFGVVDFLREATGSSIHPSDAGSFNGPYRPRDARGEPIFGKQTMFLEWVRSPHLLCSRCCKCILFDIDLFALHKRSGKSAAFEIKREREFNDSERSKKEWKWHQWTRSTDKYISQNMTRFYVVFWDNGRVLSLPIKKGPFPSGDETDIREDDPQYFDDTATFFNHIKQKIS